jgi:hypothetical protein
MMLMKKAIFFTTPIIIYLVCMGLYNFRRLEQFHILDPTIETVIAGDSHLRYSLNPEQLELAVNYCTSAEALVLTFAKIKFLLEKEDNSIKRILIPMGYHNITEAEYEKLNSPKWSNEMYTRSIPFILPALVTSEMGYENFQLFKILLTNVTLKPIDLKEQKLKTFGGFASLRMNHLEMSNLDYVIGRHFYDQNRPLRYEPKIRDLMIDICGYCAVRNVEVIIINTPLHPKYLENVPSQIKRDYDGLEAELKAMFPQSIEFLRTENMYFPDSAYLDFDHLNKYGAQIFGEFVKNELYESK